MQHPTYDLHFFAYAGIAPVADLPLIAAALNQVTVKAERAARLTVLSFGAVVFEGMPGETRVLHRLNLTLREGTGRRRALAMMCIGAGQRIAVAVERARAENASIGRTDSGATWLALAGARRDFDPSEQCCEALACRPERLVAG